ncbi:hypothetical protein IH601_10970 [Candidatus Bipolaricaulota bacterium]|nr:hypothetical protein [Candidatus Bipolaricaulota bacterium]
MRSSGVTSDGLIFRPTPPGDEGRLKLPIIRIPVGIEPDEERALLEALASGALTQQEVEAVLLEARDEYNVDCPTGLRRRLLDACGTALPDGPFAGMKTSHAMEEIALVAVKIVDRAQKALLKAEPLSEVRFDIAITARIAVRLGWEAMAKHGRFPLPPKGRARLDRLRSKPCGMMHFVSASDQDAGYYYTMGIALSPEAQALGDMDVSYGLDGELIVPGQAVAPIPPTLAMATRLFAASIPTSSNISEDIQSIPYSSFAHPEVLDICPARGYLFRPEPEAGVSRIDHARREMREQLDRYNRRLATTAPADREFLPDVGAAIDISELDCDALVPYVTEVLEGFDATERHATALFLLLAEHKADAAATETVFQMTPRVAHTCKAIDAAKALGLKYVAICDQDEDEWMPNLLEYFTASELSYLADYSDERNVIVCDGRPVDPVYTASTSAQRIQSVYTTLSVDILKMGMWLCLDALAARQVWLELLKNPHIAERMLLMPIGIIEPFSAFVDNRDRSRTPRPIVAPFEKIKFMIEEAQVLHAPSLLTDTRHKSRWVLLGSVDGDLAPHVREAIGAIPLLGHETFMACERLARKAGILLGQAGSIEADQIFWIISDTTLDAAQDGLNPATAIWTAETERVLRRADGSTLRGNLQEQRRAGILPYLAVVNRTSESHAKLNGWLEYLATKGTGDESLRLSLHEKREALQRLQDALLDAQSKLALEPGEDSDAERADYQRAWNVFSDAFQIYHTEIKDNFMRVRDRVEQAWAKA